MAPLRHLLRDHRALAMWLAGLALLLKLLVPSGFMPVASDGSVRLEVCSGMGAETSAMAAMPGMADHGDMHPAKADQPCGFGGLSAPPLPAAPLLPVAVTMLVPDWRPASSTPSLATAPLSLRPPPRGPPARF